MCSIVPKEEEEADEKAMVIRKWRERERKADKQRKSTQEKRKI
jgi:hypothetical protein